LSNVILPSASFDEKTTAGFEGGGGAMDGIDSEVYLFKDSRQLEAMVGSNDLFISFHVLGSIDAMLQFIHAIGSLKLADLVPVHACTHQIIILVFVCGMCPL
jgi:hypothetical protein